MATEIRGDNHKEQPSLLILYILSWDLQFTYNTKSCPSKLSAKQISAIFLPPPTCDFYCSSDMQNFTVSMNLGLNIHNLSLA